jgi:hypothetical protein
MINKYGAVGGMRTDMRRRNSRGKSTRAPHFPDSAVGIATGYGLDDRGVGVRVPVGQEFSLHHVLQTGSGARPASYPMGTGDSFPGGKAAGA